MSGKYQAYSAYKASNVEWFGIVPEDWSSTRLKFESLINMGQSPNSDDCNQDGYGMPFLQGNAEFGVRSPLPKQYCDIPRKIANEGQLLFSVRAPVGALNIADQKYGIGRGLCAIESCENITSTFLWWLIPVIKSELDSVSTGSTFEAVSAEQVENVVFFRPSISEQTQISNFLNHETAKIDTLIEKQQQLIKLLKEKRQAVISHAVTKGLSSLKGSQCPMRDSGVEWLGEVPEHWSVTRAKFLFDFVTSGSRGWAEFYSDEGSLFFRIANLTRDTIKPKLESIQNVLPPSGSEGERSKIKMNDLLISITADLGSVCVANEEIVDGYVSQHVSLCRPNKSVVSSMWLGYYILSDQAKEQFLGSGYGGTKVQLSLEDIRELCVVKPTESEQVEIEKYIDEKLMKFAKLVKLAENQICLLQERRTALISAAVTGKIDVRNWVAPAHLCAHDISASMHVTTRNKKTVTRRQLYDK